MSDTSAKRVHERFPIELPVLLVHAGGEARGVTKNLSLGGAALALDAPVPFGAEAKVRVRLPALKEDTEIGVTVRWLRDGLVGVQFGTLRAKDTWALNQLLKR